MQPRPPLQSTDLVVHIPFRKRTSLEQNCTSDSVLISWTRKISNLMGSLWQIQINLEMHCSSGSIDTRSTALSLQVRSLFIFYKCLHKLRNNTIVFLDANDVLLFFCVNSHWSVWTPDLEIKGIVVCLLKNVVWYLYVTLHDIV